MSEFEKRLLADILVYDKELWHVAITHKRELRKHCDKYRHYFLVNEYSAFIYALIVDKEPREDTFNSSGEYKSLYSQLLGDPI